jgi:glycosyltransferase involved in cell wall biosynthesis
MLVARVHASSRSVRSVVTVQRERGISEAHGLEIALDRPLPTVMAVGPATAVFCVGSCFHRHHPIIDLAIVVDGLRHRPTAARMPRLDRFRELHPTLPPDGATAAERDPDSPLDPELRSYRSGFWATVPIGPREQPGTLELSLEARLADGTAQRAALGTIQVVDRPETASRVRLSDTAGRPLIAICMATFNPDAELFRAQVESIRAQTYPNWVCLVSDDCSEPERFEAIQDTIAGDERFLLSRAESHLSFYRNFERALTLVPREAELVALSDHDDRWYPDKLEALADAIGSAQLAFSDVRRVDAGGHVRAETLWEGRRINHSNLASLLISNTIVGASCMFRREVIEYAVPFPSGPGWDFHDHWLALVAMALGEVAYVDRPLYDYVQHPRAILGRTASTTAGRSRGRFLERWRSAYFWLYRQREFHARVLLARCGAELVPRKRRALRLMVAAESSPVAFAWLAARPLRALLGRDETLLVEPTLVRGILWRHLLALLTRRRERPGSREADARFPRFAPDNLGRRQRRWLARQ